MNEVLKNIRERRSCRKYKADAVPAELIDAVVEAGLYAPSSLGEQSALIVAVSDKETRDKLSKLNARFTPKPDSDPFYGAPVVLIALARTARDAQFCDGCVMLENMMLAAQSLGLGSCWIHRAKEVFETEDGKEILKTAGLEGEYLGIGNLVIGYADQQPKAAPRKAGRAFFIK